MLDVSDRQIVIIGGGAVAARKAAGVLAAGAQRVRAVAPDFIASFSNEVNRVTRPYQPDDLRDAALVFAATDSAAVNDQVVRDANARNIWVNRADGSDEAAGDFITPAQFQAGSITVTVSAGSAALSTLVRDQLQQQMDPGWAAMADAMQTLRPQIKASGADVNRRRDLFRALATPEAIRILQEQGIEQLKKWISHLP